MTDTTLPDDVISLSTILEAGGIRLAVDAPRSPTGDWWLDATADGRSTEIVWHEDHGFGFFTGEDAGYGQRPDAVVRTPAEAAERIFGVRTASATPSL